MQPYRTIHSPLAWPHRAAAALLFALIALLVGTTTVWAATQVTGKITDAHGKPLSNITAVARIDYGWGYDETITTTDASGNFSLEVTGSGATYQFYFEDRELWNYYTEYYDNQKTIEAATPVVVNATPIDLGTIALDALTTVTGTIMGSDGVPVADTLVELYHEATWNYHTAYTDAQGHYTLTQVTEDSYLLRFYHEHYLPEYYDNKINATTADPVVVTRSTGDLQLNAELDANGTVTGLVTSKLGGFPLAGAEVAFYVLDTYSGYWMHADSTYTDGAGQYKFRRTSPTRQYKVRFFADHHDDEYYADTKNQDTAQILTFPTKSLTPNINAELDVYGLITGTVTGSDGAPIAGARVSRYYLDSYSQEWYDANDYAVITTDASGSYRYFVEGAGPYRFRFSHPGYEPEFYDDQPTVQTATSLAVAQNEVISNVHVVLAQGPRVAGTVTNRAGAPVAGIEVVFWRSLGDGYWEEYQTATTGSTGSYSTSVTAGSYRVGFRDPSGDYATRLYGGASDVENAQDLTFALGTQYALDMELTLIPTLRGRVTDPQGLPVQGVEISLCSAADYGSGPQWNCGYHYTYTDVDGHYTIKGLDYRVYRLYANMWFGPYVSKYYPDHYSVETAHDIDLSTGGIFTANLALDRPGYFQGTVRDDANAPITYGSVELYRLNSSGVREFVYAYDIQGDGTYYFGASMPGAYYLKFVDGYGWSEAEFYADQPDLASATPINVSLNQTQTFDIVLRRAPIITGTVTNAAGEPVPFAQISLYRRNDQQQWECCLAYGQTDETGNYVLRGVAPDTYTLRFWHIDYVEEYYQNQSALVDATPLVITAAHRESTVNVTLARLPAVSGRVQTPSGANLALATVKFYAWDGQQWIEQASQLTGDDGSYIYAYLPPGSYRIGFAHDDYGPVHYPAQEKLADAQTLTLAGDQRYTVNGQFLRRANEVIAGFSASTRAGNAPLAAAFKDRSLGPINSWSWNFGDGSTSTAQHPSHTFSAPGSYTITLQVTGPANSDTQTEVGYIQVNDTPVSGLKIIGPTQLKRGEIGEFAASITGGTRVTYAWSLGDGSQAVGPEITHLYATTGTFTLHLTATNGAGQVTASRAVKVVTEPFVEQETPVAGLTLVCAPQGYVGLPMTFEATITGGDHITYLWDFGDDSEVSTQEGTDGAITTHTYTRAGRFVVTVTAQNSAGSSEVSFTVTIARGLWLPALRRAD